MTSDKVRVEIMTNDDDLESILLQLLVYYNVFFSTSRTVCLLPGGR